MNVKDIVVAIIIGIVGGQAMDEIDFFPIDQEELNERISDEYRYDWIIDQFLTKS